MSVLLRSSWSLLNVMTLFLWSIRVWKIDACRLYLKQTTKACWIFQMSSAYELEEPLVTS